MDQLWTKRVKTNLFKSRPVRHERLEALYGFTGSVQSVVLLDQLFNILDDERSSITLLHIDISSLVRNKWSESEQLEHAKKLKNLVFKYNERFNLKIVPLENIFKMDCIELLNLLDFYKSDLTTQEDLLSYFIRSALIIFARSNNLHRIITSQCASDLAINAISSCSKGRGPQIAQECNLLETLNIDITFVKPLKDALLDREIAHYFWKHELEFVQRPKLFLHSKTSINGLAQDFMMSLQRKFDHTMHTILRSVDKLSTPKTEKSCVLCIRPLIENNSFQTCYSCHTMLFPTNLQLLPEQEKIVYSFFENQQKTVLVSAPHRIIEKQTQNQKIQKLNQKQMRSKIQEYLIDENEN